MPHYYYAMSLYSNADIKDQAHTHLIGVQYIHIENLATYIYTYDDCNVISIER